MPPVPKPPPRPKKTPKPLARRTRIAPMSARRRAMMPDRKQTRDAVIMRDRGRCRCCGAMVGDYGHAHEIVFRSQGGSPVELANVVLLCQADHERIHARLLEITVLDPVLGANGLIEFAAPTPRYEDHEP